MVSICDALLDKKMRHDAIINSIHYAINPTQRIQDNVHNYMQQLTRSTNLEVMIALIAFQKLLSYLAETIIIDSDGKLQANLDRK